MISGSTLRGAPHMNHLEFATQVLCWLVDKSISLLTSAKKQWSVTRMGHQHTLLLTMSLANHHFCLLELEEYTYRIGSWEHLQETPIWPIWKKKRVVSYSFSLKPIHGFHGPGIPRASNCTCPGRSAEISKCRICERLCAVGQTLLSSWDGLQWRFSTMGGTRVPQKWMVYNGKSQLGQNLKGGPVLWFILGHNSGQI